MEWSTWFTGLVGAIGVLHLASSAVLSMRGLPRQAATDTHAVHDDWYVFFRCSTLCGTSGQSPVAEQQQAPPLIKVAERPPVAPRPRSRARL